MEGRVPDSPVGEKGTVMEQIKTAERKESRAWDVVRRFLCLVPAGVSIAALLFASSLADRESETFVAERTEALVVSFAVIFVSIAAAILFGKFGGPGLFLRRGLQVAMLFVVPPASFVIVETFTHDVMQIGNRTKALNILFFILLELILLAVSRRPAVACTAVLALTAVTGIANNLALQARSIPIFPWDIASAGVALSVAGNYEFTFSFRDAALVAFLAGMALFSIIGGLRLPLLDKLPARIAAIVLSLAMMFGYVGYLSTDRMWTDFGLYPYLFTPDVVYERDGFFVSFIGCLKYLRVEKPDGYSEGEIESFMASYEEASRESVEKADSLRPNVIVIMNEAFSDLSVLTGGEDYWEESDPLTFFHSLRENAVSGYASVSVKGGNTANSEFEFLTGMSMAFLPEGSIPYQQYLKAEAPSLASQFSALGYDTLAMHPYVASGWDRDDVYGYFGFDGQLFYQDFYDNPTHYRRVRSYISDDSLVNKITDLYEEHEAVSDAPIFYFAVTMQNHGGYTNAADYPTFRQTVHATGVARDDLTTYLSLLQLSDRALEKLVNYFWYKDEPTVIVMFGDHQPNDSVVNALAKYYGTDISSSAEAVARRYEVPFVIWANFDIEEAENVETSLNYLPSLVLEAAGLPLTPAQLYLRDEVAPLYPTLSAAGARRADGSFIAPDALNEEDGLRRWAMVQYNYLFGKKNRLANLFRIPVKQQ